MKAEKPETIFPKEIADALKVPKFSNKKITELETQELHELAVSIESAEVKSKNSKNKVILNYAHELVSEEIEKENNENSNIQLQRKRLKRTSYQIKRDSCESNRIA